MRETLLTKLQMATCDKPDLDRRFRRIWRALKDVEKAVEGGGDSREKRKTGQ